MLATSLPASGRSLFEEYIDANGGEVPYPFTALMDFMDRSAGKPEGSSPRLFLPDGRSLASDATDFRDPRLIFSNRDRGGFNFMGFAKRKGQIEVISWDPDRKSPTFLVISDYEKGKRPRIEKGGPICATCHQGGGGIFPREPWREMTDVLATHKAGKKLFDELKKHHPETYQGLDLSSMSKDARRAATSFDDDVAGLSDLMQYQSACERGCGQDIACREALFKMFLRNLKAARFPKNKGRRNIPRAKSLRPGTRSEVDLDSPFDESTAHAEFATLKSRLKSLWPSDGFAYRAFTLPDRDPLTPKSESPGFKWVIGGNGKLANGEDPTFNPEAQGQQIFSDLSPLEVDGRVAREVPLSTAEAALADPKTTRPLVGGIPKKDAAAFLYTNSLRCFFPDLKVAEMAMPYLKDSLSGDGAIDRVLSSPKVKRSLAKAWPPSGRDLVTLILVASGTPEGQIPPCFHPEAFEPIDLVTLKPTIDVVDSMKKEERKVLQKFQIYCGSCHKAGMLPLPLDDLGALSRYKSDSGETVFDRLMNREMPPESSPQPEKDSEGDQRNTMIEAAKPGHGP